MKSELEIQKAHDTLVAVITEQAKIGLSDEDKKVLTVQCDVLCWILKHEENKSFQENLDKVVAELTEKGYVRMPISTVKN